MIKGIIWMLSYHYGEVFFNTTTDGIIDASSLGCKAYRKALWLANDLFPPVRIN
jgi:hypothetical protein